MSSDGFAEDADGAEGATEEVPRPTGEVVLAEAPHSALVGLMAEPVSRSIPVRRSTVLMLVAFLGFGTLQVLYPPAAKTVTTITTNNPNGFLPGVLPTTTTTTHPAPSTTTTTRPPDTPTTAGPASTSTTAPTGSSTTTTRVGGTTTSSTPSSTTAP